MPESQNDTARNTELAHGLRAAEDKILVLGTRLDHIEDGNKSFREEVRNDLGELRDDLGQLRKDIFTKLKELSDDLRETRSVKSWIIGIIAAGGASTGGFFAIGVWNAIKTLWMS